MSLVLPDGSGGISAGSPVIDFEGTEPLAQIGGMAFGIDENLYIASREKGSIFRYRFDGAGEPEGPELVARVGGGPGAMAEGADGALYFVTNQLLTGELWKIPFDETLSPEAPFVVAALPGEGLSLALDPVSGALFALGRDPGGDTVVWELSRRWLRDPSQTPRTIFRLRQFRDEMAEPTLPMVSVRLPRELLPDDLDFLSFDSLGMLYLGATAKDLVMKFELDRPDVRHAVGVAAVVAEEGASPSWPVVRLHAWTKSPLAR